MTMPRAEVITSVQRRRRWSREEKERLVSASLEPGAGASEVARAAGIHASQLFRWRKELCERSETSVASLVPVKIVPSLPPREAEEPSLTAVRRNKSHGIIEIELGGGCRVRVDRDVDIEALQRVLELLRR